MYRMSRLRLLVGLLPMLLLLLLFGSFFLAQNAPRDWSLHWVAPRIALASTSGSEFVTVPTARGFDIVYTTPRGQLVLARMDAKAHRVGPKALLRGTPEANNQSIALGRAGNMDVVAWREDLANISRLRVAIVLPGRAPLYRTLAAGPWPLEHPRAFTVGTSVGLVFSWQRGGYNVYLSRISPRGTVMRPRSLTHTSTYAFNPHAVIDATGAIQLVYMQLCCTGTAMDLVSARFTQSGRPLGTALHLDRITSVVGAGQGGTPDRWGLDLKRDGARTIAAWSDDSGIAGVVFRGGNIAVPAHVVVPGIFTSALTLVLGGGGRELVWQQPFELGANLSTVQLDARALPIGQLDRVTFEAASDQAPVAVPLAGRPGVLWQALPTNTNLTTVEYSRFSPRPLPAPSVWARLGLGLNNPLGSFALLVVGGVAIGILIAAANVILIMALVALYLLVFRTVQGRWKWYAYAAAITAVFFGLFVAWGAPSPPVLFLTALSQSSSVLALLGLLLFVGWFGRMGLRRTEDVYRAGAMAAAAFFFLGFLQALILMQGQIARI